jgi:hypothetical protein
MTIYPVSSAHHVQSQGESTQVSFSAYVIVQRNDQNPSGRQGTGGRAIVRVCARAITHPSTHRFSLISVKISGTFDVAENINCRFCWHVAGAALRPTLPRPWVMNIVKLAIQFADL